MVLFSYNGVICMNSVAIELSRSIKEGKWVSIQYHNRNQEDTFFWIAIKNVIPNTRKLIVDMFNSEKSLECLEEKEIAFDSIREAHCIEGTTCEIQIDLINQIINNYASFSFLEFTGINTRILQYYKACYQNDRSCSVHNYQLLAGLDIDVLTDQTFKLTTQKFHEIIKLLHIQLSQNKKQGQQDIVRLGINILGIIDKETLIPYVYRELLLNIKEKSFYVAKENSYNLLIDDTDSSKKYRLSNFFDGDLSYFMYNYDTLHTEFTNNIISNLPYYLKLDERPYLFELHKKIHVSLEKEYEQIAVHIQNNTLSNPLSIFLGKTNTEKSRKGKNILLLNSSINVNQLRVIYNALIKDVLYVQGPPGTGKTNTIINLITSCFLNKQKVLICSNNNEAIENIYRKMQFKDFFFPILRLGSHKYVYDTLAKLHTLLPSFSELNDGFDIETISNHFESSNRNVQLLLSKYEHYLEEEERRSALKEIMEHISLYEDIDELTKFMFTSGLDLELQKPPLSFDEDSFAKINEMILDKEEVLQYLHLMSKQMLSKIRLPKYKNLYDIIALDCEEERYYKFTSYIKKDQGMNDLLSIFPFIISTNLGSYRLGTPSPHFDLVIMDEASQCSNAVSLLPLSRANRMVLVGDQNQLQPVITISDSLNTSLMNTYDIPMCYDYKHNSILTTLLKVDALSKFILLKEHYRCAKDIINFSNQKYYDNELVIRSKSISTPSLQFVNIDSSEHQHRNCCQEEIEAILELVSKEPKDKSIAVITPFKSQAKRIQSELANHALDTIKVGTIHTFQGDEKDTIILSSGISKATSVRTFSWLKDNQELINVATTRAKEKLILLADEEMVEILSENSANDFLELVHYVAENGKSNVAYKENTLFKSKVKNYKYFNTKSEEIFLETLLHFKSIYGQVKIKEKVKVSDALALNKQEKELFMYGNQAHFDFLLYDIQGHPLLAIEVCGHEHFDNQKALQNDQMKAKICQRHNLKLFIIKNDYVRRYTYIKENILRLLKE